jgi:SHS2 domain-containing protein
MTTEMSTVEPVYSMDFETEGHDLHSMIFNLLDTCLYNFCAEPFFIGSKVKVLKFTTASEAENLPDEEGCSRQCSVSVRC